MKLSSRWIQLTLASVFMLVGIGEIACGQGRMAPGAKGATAPPAAAAAQAAPVAQEDTRLSPEIEAKLNEALDKFKKSDVPGAIESLKALYQAHPEVKPPRIFLASWFSQIKNVRAARGCLELATEETPADPEAYLLLGEFAYQEGELTAAELLYRKAAETLEKYTANPERAKNIRSKTMHEQVKLAQSRERWDEMQGILATLLKDEGQTAEIVRLIAFSFFQKKEDENAQKWLAQLDAIQGDKQLSGDAVMARFYMSRDNMAKAREALAAALQKYPKDTEVLGLAVILAINEKDLKSAGLYADQLLASSPDAVNSMRTCATVMLYRGEYAKAEELFKKALAKAPNDSDITNGLALALAEQNNPEKMKLALQYAAGNVQKQQNNRALLATLGWVLYKSGDKAKAREILNQSAANAPLNPTSAYYLAVMLADEGKNDQAKKLLEAASASKAPFIKQTAAAELLKKLAAAK